MTLTATEVQARCEVRDITMRKVFPTGDPERNSPFETFVRFSLPGDCPATNPPLDFCVTVWHNSPCKSISGAACEGAVTWAVSQPT